VGSSPIASTTKIAGHGSILTRSNCKSPDVFMKAAREAVHHELRPLCEELEVLVERHTYWVIQGTFRRGVDRPGERASTVVGPGNRWSAPDGPVSGSSPVSIRLCATSRTLILRCCDARRSM
jgi:hypothetical protein